MANFFSFILETTTSLLQPFFNLIGLPLLGSHWHILLSSMLVCSLIDYASSQIMPLLLPKAYGSLSKFRKINWNHHVVSMVHCITIIILAIPIFGIESLSSDRAFGYDPYTGDVFAITSGYFLWDTIATTLHVRQLGFSFVLHGIVCFSVFIFSYQPFLMYFGAHFLMFELSTPFLNIHWFMDKLNMTGSIWQAVNGVLLLATFFFARIVFGIWSSLQFLEVVNEVRRTRPTIAADLYSVACLIMNILNIYWFRAMVVAVLKRFKAPATDKTSTPAGVDKTIAKAVTGAASVGTVLDSSRPPSPPKSKQL